jgi:sugar phosphate isomerase/epimerase
LDIHRQSGRNTKIRRKKMPHFEANFTFLFAEMPFMDRFTAAKRAGFDAAEFMFPYDYDQEDIKKQILNRGFVPISCPRIATTGEYL